MTARRTYSSTLREEQAAATRRAVVDAARELFLVKGWSGTSMRDVAAAAGVSLETVYSHHAGKKGLLRAVADASVVGDDAPVALAERPAFAAIGRGARAARVRAAAEVAADVHERTAPLARLLREAAPTDGEIAEMLRATRERQRADVAAAFSLVVGREPTPAERDGVWAVTSPEVFLLLVDGSGWTPAEYEAWMAETLERVLPRS